MNNLKNVLFVLVGLSKTFIIYFSVTYGVSLYDSNLPFYKQHILVWLLLYIPIFSGYEVVITTVIEKLQNKIK